MKIKKEEIAIRHYESECKKYFQGGLIQGEINDFLFSSKRENLESPIDEFHPLATILKENNRSIKDVLRYNIFHVDDEYYQAEIIFTESFPKSTCSLYLTLKRDPNNTFQIVTYNRQKQ